MITDSYKKITDEILRLKFLPQTDEIKLKIQKLQQRLWIFLNKLNNDNMKYELKYVELIADETGSPKYINENVILDTDDLDNSWKQYCRNRRIKNDAYEIVSIIY